MEPFIEIRSFNEKFNLNVSEISAQKDHIAAQSRKVQLNSL